MRQGVDRLLALVDAQRTEASTVGASLAGIRSELQRVTESQAELTAAQQAVEGRVSAVAARQSEQDFAAPVVGALRQRVDDLQAEVRSLVEAEGTALRASVEEGLADARLEATARDQQLQRGMSRLSAMVEALRSELESSIDGAVRFEMETAKKAQEELAEAQGHLERRLDGLDQRVRDALERLYDRVEPATHPVAAPLSNGESLLDELERKLVDAQRRLTERAGTEAN
jgi:uncharacterized phage infection (PIP) family protein YhgE